MNSRFITPLFAAVLLGSVSSAYPFSYPGQEQQKQPKTPPKSSAQATLTGCLDEQDGRYVLTDDREMKPIATLEADGFPTEGFAKHMGHKVTVRGTTSSDTPVPVFKVRSIETIAESCSPQR